MIPITPRFEYFIDDGYMLIWSRRAADLHIFVYFHWLDSSQSLIIHWMNGDSFAYRIDYEDLNIVLPILC